MRSILQRGALLLSRRGMVAVTFEPGNDWRRDAGNRPWGSHATSVSRDAPRREILQPDSQRLRIGVA